MNTQNNLKLRRLLLTVPSVIIAAIGLSIDWSAASTVRADDLPGLPDANYGLAIEIDDGNIELKPASPLGDLLTASQHIRVKTGYHMGYDLTLTGIGGVAMQGRQFGDVIRPTIDSSMLSVGSWGFARGIVTDDDVTQWMGLPANGAIVQSNYGDYPGGVDNIDELDISYGARPGPTTLADTYAVNLRYTLTAREPTTPAILRLENNRQAIGAASQATNITGVRLDRVRQLAVDFDNDGAIDAGEECINWTVEAANNFYANCQWPAFAANLAPDDNGGVFAVLMQDQEGVISATGQTMTYYYQPEIQTADSLDGVIPLKDHVKIIDMVSTDSSTLMLADDGDVYLWGDTPLAKTSWQYTAAPHLYTDFPIIERADRIVDVAANGRSYVAVSKEGHVHAWGDNSEFRLPLEDRTTWIEPAQQSIYYNTGGDNRQAYQVDMGDGFAVSVDQRIGEGHNKNLSSWGINDYGQRGDNLANGGSVHESDHGSYVVGYIYDGSYPINKAHGEHFTQVSAGQASVATVTNGGRVFTWGANRGGLGFSTTDNAVRPHEITSNKDDNYLRQAYHNDGRRFTMVAMGNNFLLALAQDKDNANQTYVYALGQDDQGQVGNGVVTASRNQAYDITGQFNLSDDDSIVGIVVDDTSAAAWSRHGRTFIWGNNTNGKLSVVKPATITQPTEILQGYQVDKVELGDINYARTKDGRLLAWSGHASDSQQPWLANDGQVTDITSWLTKPMLSLAVTGNNLDRADIWVDFNRNGIMDVAERPLAKQCTPMQCQLQISTRLAEVPNDDENVSYDIYATTKYGGQAMKLAVVSTRRDADKNYPERLPEPIIDVDANPKMTTPSVAIADNVTVSTEWRDESSDGAVATTGTSVDDEIIDDNNNNNETDAESDHNMQNGTSDDVGNADGSDNSDKDNQGDTAVSGETISDDDDGARGDGCNQSDEIAGSADDNDGDSGPANADQSSGHCNQNDAQFDSGNDIASPGTTSDAIANSAPSEAGEYLKEHNCATLVDRHLVGDSSPPI